MQVNPAVPYVGVQARLVRVESIHKRIKRLRIAKGLRQEDLAAKAGVSYQSVQEWERENGTAPARKRQKAVAAALGVSVEELMTGVASGQDGFSTVEALIVEHVRALMPLQQQELLKRLRALNHANKISKVGLDLKSLTGVSNEAVEKAFGAAPPPRKVPRRVRSAGHINPHPGDPDKE